MNVEITASLAISRIMTAALIGALLALACPVAQSIAQDSPERPVEVVETPVTPDEGFSYQLENRPDPFVPFITEKAAVSTVDPNEIIEEMGPLSGMQLFEPGQLTLVALLSAGSEEFAMVEDFTGKGYVIEEGTLIGRRGVVKDITTNRVIIEETAETRAGRKIVTELEMLLRKEGEE